MRRGWGPLRRALLLLWLARLTLPGDGNEGSVTGSCLCRKIVSSSSPPPAKVLDHLRKELRTYSHCLFYIRFHLQHSTVCGGSQDPWVLELVSCFDGGECGHDHWKSSIHQRHPLPPSTVIPEPTEGVRPDVSSLAQTQSPQQPILPSGALPLDTELTHLSETTTHTSDYSLGAGPEAGENKKQQDEKPGAVSTTSAMVPVLSLLAIVFFLIAALLYVLCTRRRKQSQQYCPDLQLHYISMTQDSDA
uniref:C-X-C motif chemokine 16 isoform X2 n=1 Tax=Jaculus jaculus TaxID=51337 RepID=UPI001E1B5A63|nr:C-X-C motif chemokine 16 isoform X2 [Jaculus jaculus]